MERHPATSLIRSATVIVSALVFLVVLYLGSAHLLKTRSSHGSRGTTTHYYDATFKGQLFIPAAWLEANLIGKRVIVRVEIEHPAYYETTLKHRIEPFWCVVP